LDTTRSTCRYGPSRVNSVAGDIHLSSAARSFTYRIPGRSRQATSRSALPLVSLQTLNSWAKWSRTQLFILPQVLSSLFFNHQLSQTSRTPPKILLLRLHNLRLIPHNQHLHNPPYHTLRPGLRKLPPPHAPILPILPLRTPPHHPPDRNTYPLRRRAPHPQAQRESSPLWSV
jgi:hypothetical protein